MQVISLLSRKGVLLRVDYLDYGAKLAEFFDVNPEIGETISLDGKTLKGSYLVQEDNPESEPHPAVILGRVCKSQNRVMITIKNS